MRFEDVAPRYLGLGCVVIVMVNADLQWSYTNHQTRNINITEQHDNLNLFINLICIALYL